MITRAEKLVDEEKEYASQAKSDEASARAALEHEETSLSLVTGLMRRAESSITGLQRQFSSTLRVTKDIWKLVFEEVMRQRESEYQQLPAGHWIILQQRWNVPSILSSVCRLWRQAALDTPQLWKNFFLFWSQRSEQGFETYIQRSQRRFARLSITGPLFQPIPSIKRLEDLLQSIEHVSDMNYSAMNYSVITSDDVNPLQLFPPLDTLTINAKMGQLSVKACQTVSYLTADANYAQYMLNMRLITSRDAYTCIQEKEEAALIGILTQSSRKLRTLVLSGFIPVPPANHPKATLLPSLGTLHTTATNFFNFLSTHFDISSVKTVCILSRQGTVRSPINAVNARTNQNLPRHLTSLVLQHLDKSDDKTDPCGIAAAFIQYLRSCTQVDQLTVAGSAVELVLAPLVHDAGRLANVGFLTVWGYGGDCNAVRKALRIPQAGAKGPGVRSVLFTKMFGIEFQQCPQITPVMQKQINDLLCPNGALQPLNGNAQV